MLEPCEEIRQLNQQAWSDRNKDVQKSLQLARQAQALLAECPQAGTQDMVENLRAQGYCLEHLSRYREALHAALKAIQLANQSGDQRMIASLDNLLGSIYWRLDDYSVSLNHFLHGLRLVQTEPDQELEAFLFQGLGTVHYVMGDYSEALKYFKLSVEIAPPEDIVGQAIGYNNLAYTLHEIKQDEEALPYAQQALTLFEQDQLSVGRLECLHTLGSIYSQMGDTDRAMGYFQAGAEAAEKCGNLLQKLNALFGICQINQKRGALDSARQMLLGILRTAEDIGSLASQCTAHEQLAGIYKQLGNYQVALEHYETFHAIHVRLFNEQSDGRAKNAQVLHDVETIRQQADLYRILAATDSLTGLLSRREFLEQAEKVMIQAAVGKQPVVMLMIDLDNFKQVNDQHGHAVGDQVLTAAAGRLKQSLRQRDLAGRYGGDEFVVLLPETSLRQGWNIAERCKEAVADTPVEVGLEKVPVSISVGLATLEPHCTMGLEEFIIQADRALLAAKQAGRNQIICS